MIVEIDEEATINFAWDIDASFFPSLANGTLLQPLTLVYFPFRESKFIPNLYHKYFRVFTIKDDCAADWFVFKKFIW